MKRLIFVILCALLGVWAEAQTDSIVRRSGDTTFTTTTTIKKIVTDNEDYQPKNRRNFKKGLLIYSTATLSTVAGYSLNHQGNTLAQKQWGHALNAFGIGVYGASPFLMDYDYEKPEVLPGWLKITLTYMGSIALNAIGDGLLDGSISDGKRRPGLGYACNAVSRGLLVASPTWINYKKDKWGWYLASYVTLRASFDPIYNGTRGLPLEYYGQSSLTDRITGAFKPKYTLPRKSIFVGLGLHMTIVQIK